MPAMSVESVSGADRDLFAILAAAHLPIDDLDGPSCRFFRFSDDRGTVGYGGMEVCGDAALIRSIVVVPARRGAGIGQALTKQLLTIAGESGLRRAYLFTTTAKTFFERLGFVATERSSAPHAVLKTRQATGACRSAALLSRETASS